MFNIWKVEETRAREKEREREHARRFCAKVTLLRTIVATLPRLMQLLVPPAGTSRSTCPGKRDYFDASELTANFRRHKLHRISRSRGRRGTRRRTAPSDQTAEATAAARGGKEETITRRSTDEAPKYIFPPLPDSKFQASASEICQSRLKERKKKRENEGGSVRRV